MRVEVLISCMNQKDASIVSKTNVQSDVLVINQCNENKEEKFEFFNKTGELCKARMIFTTERGLSKSRNMAIRNATGDICLICDDDEILKDDYVDTIEKAFMNYPKNDIIAFNVQCPNKIFPAETYNINLYLAAGISSWQIAFKRLYIKSIFCERMGSGTGNGGGEENKFLVDNLKKGCKIRYVPGVIGKLEPSNSFWFHGYDKQYWINRGWTAKMIYGYILGYVYLWYCIIFRNKSVDKQNSWYKIIVWMHRGLVKR